MKKIIFALSLLLIANCISAQRKALVGGTLVDGYGGKPILNSVVIINGETIEKAFKNILSLLNPNGRFLFSFTGNGYNPQLEEYLKRINVKLTSFPTIKGSVCFGEIIK
jgi:hypothetical protein